MKAYFFQSEKEQVAFERNNLDSVSLQEFCKEWLFIWMFTYEGLVFQGS